MHNLPLRIARLPLNVERELSQFSILSSQVLPRKGTLHYPSLFYRLTYYNMIWLYFIFIVHILFCPLHLLFPNSHHACPFEVKLKSRLNRSFYHGKLLLTDAYGALLWAYMFTPSWPYSLNSESCFSFGYFCKMF